MSQETTGASPVAAHPEAPAVGATETSAADTVGTTRRGFLTTTALGVAAVTMGVPLDAKATTVGGRGQVLRVHHSGATTDIIKTNDDVVKTMVDKALLEFTGEATIAAAMGHFVQKTDLVGIKINTLGSPYSSVNPATAFAIADAVHAAGVPKTKIIIYDQYQSRMKTGGFRVLGPGGKARSGQYPVHYHKTLGYEEEETPVEGRDRRDRETKARFAKIARQVTAVINVCVPKDHDLTGVTGALKNVAYGNVETVPHFHCSREKCKPVCFHDGKCNIPRVYSHPDLGGKVKLIICDALRVLYNGGPQDKRFRVAHNEIAITTDPVAMDRVILEWVEDIRKEKGMDSVWESRGGTRAPRFIEGAVKMGLGEGDLAKITQKRISIG